MCLERLSLGIYLVEQNNVLVFTLAGLRNTCLTEQSNVSLVITVVGLGTGKCCFFVNNPTICAGEILRKMKAGIHVDKSNTHWIYFCYFHQTSQHKHCRVWFLQSEFKHTEISFDRRYKGGALFYPFFHVLSHSNWTCSATVIMGWRKGTNATHMHCPGRSENKNWKWNSCPVVYFEQYISFLSRKWLVWTYVCTEK